MKTYILSLLVLFAWLYSGCKTAPDLPQAETLELSIGDHIQMKQEGESIQVEIKTSEAQWSYLGGSNWLKLSKSGGRLVLTSLANETLQKRRASVVVRAGQISRTLEVEQLGRAQLLELSQQAYEVDQWGQEITFIMEYNLQDLEVISSASEWIKYEINSKKKEFRIIVAENKAYAERSATLYLRDIYGNGDAKISIKQEGAMYYVLPYGGFNETEEEVKEFEAQRRSILIGKPSGIANPLIGGNANLWTFETKSKAFNVIQYVIEPDERRYRNAIAWATDPRLFARDKEFDNAVAFLLKEGFVLRRNSTYYSEKHECQALVAMSNEGSFIMYTFEPKQPKAMPTFKQFPWGVLRDKSWRDYDRDRVEAWEAEHGGHLVLEEEQDDKLSLVFASDDFGGMLRIYSINEHSDVHPLVGVLHVFTKTDQVYYHERGATVLTKEFSTLARGEKFEFSQYLDARIFLFEHKDRTLYMGAYRSEVEDPEHKDQQITVAKLEFLSTQLSLTDDSADKSLISRALGRAKRINQSKH